MVLDSGLLALTVPAAFGGPQCSVVALAEAHHRVAQADPDLARRLHGHHLFLRALTEQGTHEQQEYFFAEALAGACFAGVGLSGGVGSGPAITLARWRNGVYRLDGESVCEPGVLQAEWLVVRAVLVDELAEPADEPDEVFAVIRRDDLGVTHDGGPSRLLWLDGVRVAPGCVIPYSTLFDRPTTFGARRRVIAAAVAGSSADSLQAAALLVDEVESTPTIVDLEDALRAMSR